ncbi:hypothetical protein DICSQDRAFT_141042 [Dichomitus squalens LYAD-421 SS1]|uniref:Uncharacterized protein n=2 Tax=Dichomitus squalens TaxID=114155 RepID=A0A4Q9PVL4_9APHY|nr:uncharacterized protein DICSQDRAFT_141042 [Dichomitus squalens LYAD-421 SS1]EJF56700.1 hypothetical protein DICSQDRAFT_141042 [Dichomitus squalens LYAD-421 SS1]TBU58530.1 hypothetical protein BD310DRAFT_819248 [Dichomitus squalens]
MSTTNLVPPGSVPQQQRRLSLPPPPSPLNLPEPVYGNRRPPSPLRNGFAIDPHTGEVSDASSAHQSEDSNNDRQWGLRSTSPSPSVGQFAANIAQRVGSLMSNMSSRSPGLPTDEELEAEAERERERSRREAERILAREAEERERRTVEERVMAMLQQGNTDESLRPPPSRSQTMPATPPSPSSSQKESNWWTVAKQKLTPTKEPLTPAQQIIQETKQRDKEIEKGKKKQERKKSKDWPTTPESKFEDPAFAKLGLSASPGRAVSAVPSSPSPMPRGIVSIPPSLAPSPMRGTESEAEGASPSRAPQPIYAQFNAQGALDVPGTLLTITKRFEKLEKWTVSHVRALEERMDDVERWLVEKEREKEESHTDGNTGIGDSALSDLREEMAELQGRIGELGREMAKMVTAPGNLTSGPSRSPAALGRAPSTSSSIAIHSIPRNVTSPPRATPPRAAGTTSPNTTTPVPSNRSSRTRLPYPTGDYASPTDSAIFSPTNSPPASLTSATRSRHMSIAGLPSQEGSGTFSASVSPSGLPNGNGKRVEDSASPNNALPTPNPPAWRPSSASPTPRKRYTVALGQQIMPRERSDREEAAASAHPRPTTPQSRDVGTAYFSTSPLSTSSALDDPLSSSQSADESDGGFGDETIGKSSGRHVSGTLAPPSHAASPSSSPNGDAKARRARPQSMYAPLGSQAISAPSPITPLNIRLRSRSTDRFGLGLSDASNGAPIPPVTPTSGKFVDPLVARRQAKLEAQLNAGPPPPKALVGKKKVPVGELVAFFDQEKA